jgi:hypothetical protein
MQLSIRLVVYPVHMANRKSLGPILVHEACGKLAGAENRNEYFFSVVLGTGIVVDAPTFSDRVASARPAFPDLNGVF